MISKELGHKWIGRMTIISGVLTLTGCGGDARETPQLADEAPATPAPARTARPATATVTGQIVFQGEAPKTAPIKMDADPICQEQHPGQVYTQEYIIGDSGELANVFVYVKSGLEEQTFPPATDTVIFDQRGCQYYPHVFGMRVNQPLAILNSDRTLHNVHPLPKNSKGFNLGMPKQGMRVTKTFTAPEVMVKIKCDVHPWMRAYAGVLNHPHFAVTGEDGRYTIGPLASGNYVIEAWHEKLGTMTEAVTLSDNETKNISFTFTEQAM